MTKKQKSKMKRIVTVITTSILLVELGLHLEHRFKEGVTDPLPPPIVATDPRPPADPQLSVLPECSPSLKGLLDAIGDTPTRADIYVPVRLYIHDSHGKSEIRTLTAFATSTTDGNFTAGLAAAGFHAEWNFDRSTLVIQPRETGKTDCLILKMGMPDAFIVHTDNAYQYDLWHTEFLRGTDPLVVAAKAHVSSIHFKTPDLLSPVVQAQLLSAAFGGDTKWREPTEASSSAGYYRVDLQAHRTANLLSMIHGSSMQH